MADAVQGTSKDCRMGGKSLQLVAYIVLVAILTAAGFGALGPAAAAF
jgi:hypothetical protein